MSDGPINRSRSAAAGDALLLGCNTIGHLGAGLFEVQRTGDDTSGRVWERTRRMGAATESYEWEEPFGANPMRF